MRAAITLPSLAGEAVEKIVHRNTNAKNTLPHAVAGALTKTAAELDAAAAHSTEETAFTSHRSRFESYRAELNELRDEAMQQLAATRGQLAQIGADEQVQNVDEFEKRVNERFDALDAAISEVEGSQADNRAQAIDKVKGLLKRYTHAEEPANALGNEPISTFRQDVPLEPQPQEAAQEPPQYVSAPTGADAVTPAAASVAPATAAVTPAAAATLEKVFMPLAHRCRRKCKSAASSRMIWRKRRKR